MSVTGLESYASVGSFLELCNHGSQITSSLETMFYGKKETLLQKAMNGYSRERISSLRQKYEDNDPVLFLWFILRQYQRLYFTAGVAELTENHSRI
jgi:hypothetical protein